MLTNSQTYTQISKQTRVGLLRSLKMRDWDGKCSCKYVKDTEHDTH